MSGDHAPCTDITSYSFASPNLHELSSLHGGATYWCVMLSKTGAELPVASRTVPAAVMTMHQTYWKDRAYSITAIKTYRNSGHDDCPNCALWYGLGRVFEVARHVRTGHDSRHCGEVDTEHRDEGLAVAEVRPHVVPQDCPCSAHNA